MYRLRLGVTALMVGLLAGGLLLGDDSKGKDDKDSPVIVKAGRLPKNYKKLGLSEDQTKKLYQIMGTYQAKIDELESKKKALRKEENAQMEKVLTEAQLARLKELMLGETGKDKGPDKDKAPEKAPVKDK